MSAVERLSYCAAELRRNDPERFLTALLAPPDRREDLFALYAFNHEVAKTAEVVSEPILGQIRLQWWRESLDGIYAGTPRRHYAVEPLARAIERAGLPRADFDRLIDARDGQDLDDAPPATLAALETYAAATGGAPVALALRLLGAEEAETLAAGEAAGTAYALAGLLRALPFQLRRGRHVLPPDLLARHGIAEFELRNRQPPARLPAALAEIAALAAGYVADARKRAPLVPRAMRSPLLHASLADLHLRRLRRRGYDVFRPELAEAPPTRPLLLALHGLTGRI